MAIKTHREWSKSFKQDPVLKTIVRAPKGEGRTEVPLEDVQVPDMWHLAMWLKSPSRAQTLDQMSMEHWGEMVLETWHLAHDLLLNIKGGDCVTPFSYEKGF